MPAVFETKDDIKQVSDAATSKLNEVLKELTSLKTPVLLLVSGGSALQLLDGLGENNLGSNITISVLDERYSENPSANNFAQVVISPFYSRAVTAGCKFIDTHVNRRKQEQLAADFNKNLNDWIKDNPSGKIIATIGMGSDGHTSGMMPFPEDSQKFKDLFEPKDSSILVTSYDATGKNPYPARITTNMNLMRRINTGIVFITGENKENAFKKLRAKEGTLAETPARIVNSISDCFVFTDLSS